jgi:hypothetical protein
MGIDNNFKLLGRGLFEESRDFGRKYIKHKSEHEEVLHVSMEGHIHLFKNYWYSPRFWFTATQGQSGKTTCLYKSELFVPCPQHVLFAGAGLLRNLHDRSQEGLPMPTVFYEEVQELFNGNPDNPVKHMIHTYKAGADATRPIVIGDITVQQRMFYPVMVDGLINKYPIPQDFLQRCIQIQMIKRKASELVEDFEQTDLEEEIGDSFRNPRMEWASKVTREDIKAIRLPVKHRLVALGIDARDRELLRPLVEYAWFCGDDVYERAIAAAEYYHTGKSLVVELTIDQELLECMYDICMERTATDILSKDLVTTLHSIPESPWNTYGKQEKPINQHNVATLLRPYGITTHKDSSGNMRYSFFKLIDVWERVLNKKRPPHLN